MGARRVLTGLAALIVLAVVVALIVASVYAGSRWWDAYRAGSAEPGQCRTGQQGEGRHAGTDCGEGVSWIRPQPQEVRVGAELEVLGARNLLVAPTGTKVVLSGPSTRDMSGPDGHVSVEIRDLADIDEVTTVPVRGDSVDALSWTSDGSTVVAAVTTLWPPGQKSGALVAIEASSGRIVFSVPLGRGATAMALSPDDSRVYLTDRDAFLLVLDRATGARVAAVPLGGEGAAIAAAPDGRSVHVVGTTGLTTVDAASHTVTKTLGLRDVPADIALTPDGRTAVVTTSAIDSVVGINLDSGAVEWSVAVGDEPVGVVVTPDGLQALVANSNGAGVTVVDLATRNTRGVLVGEDIEALTLSPLGDFGFIETRDRVLRFDRGIGAGPATDTGTPAPGAAPLVVEPVVPGWNVVRSARRAALYDVPPDWTVDPEGVITGFGSEGGWPLGKPLVAGSGSASTGPDGCGEGFSRALSITTQNDTDVAEAAVIAAENWADAAYRTGRRPPELRTGEPQTVTTVTGKRAALVEVAATAAAAVGDCGAGGVVYALGATGFTGELGPTVAVVVVARVGPHGSVPEDEIRQVLRTLRPER